MLNIWNQESLTYQVVRDKEEVVLIGYSGHGYVVCDALLSRGEIIDSYCDLNVADENPFNLKFLGSEKDDNFDWKKDRVFLLGIGDNALRVKIANHIVGKGKDIKNVIHPNSLVSKFSILGKGVFINGGAIINSFSKIGDFCIINTGAIVEHECCLAEGVHIAPGAVLLGNVKVGRNSFIGGNSVIKQGIVIGENCIIGAGSVVVKDVADGCMVYGNPAK